MQELSIQKKAYAKNLSVQLDKYLMQQEFILRHLAKTTLNASNIAFIEDLLFAFANQDLSVPLNIHVVSFDGQQRIIGSSGFSNSSVLAPDEEYYMRLADNPANLSISKLYANQEMPNYLMINLGLGYLDARLAVSDLQNYLAKELGSKLFNFAFNDSLLQPELKICLTACVIAFIKYAALRLAILLAICSWVYMFYRAYTKLKKQAKDLSIYNLQIQELNAQNKYLAAIDNATSIKIVDMHTLVQDIKSLNLSSAVKRGVQVYLPDNNMTMIKFYAEQHKLIQVLSGILYQMIGQNCAGSKIQIKINLVELDKAHRRIIFIFSDNGFYDSLQDQNEVLPASDIRCQGWGNIYSMTDALGASLEYVHTAYVGNTVVVSIVVKIVNNVVNLEEYFQPV